MTTKAEDGWEGRKESSRGGHGKRKCSSSGSDRGCLEVSVKEAGLLKPNPSPAIVQSDFEEVPLISVRVSSSVKRRITANHS